MEQTVLENEARRKSLEETKSKDAWDKADILGKLLGSILIPIGLAYAGFKANSALQDRTAQQQTYQIAITVLQAKDTPLPSLRKWAERVFIRMNADAGNPLSQEAERELPTGPLPATEDAALPTSCPFDATKISGKELAERFEGAPVDSEAFMALEQQIKSKVGTKLSECPSHKLVSHISGLAVCP